MKGIIFALFAATCNSSIGVFNSMLFTFGLQSIEVVLVRCFLAFIIIFLLAFYSDRQDLFYVSKEEILKYIVLAFFGINIMYICETSAIMYIDVSLVSFLLYASGIWTIILSCIFLQERLNKYKIIAILCVLIGIGIIFAVNSSFNGNLLGMILAIGAGMGYSMYIFLHKKWQVKAGLKTLFYLFLFGSCFLGIQALLFVDNFTITNESLPYLFLLAIIPTIGGFFCTNKAINNISAGTVQIVEMSEPFIATILAFLFLQQMPSIYEFIGGICIVVGLLCIVWEQCLLREK